jgi:3-oxoacyl-[acyl-carrier protein] reductase
LDNEIVPTEAISRGRIFHDWRIAAMEGGRRIGREVTLAFSAQGASVAVYGHGQLALDTLEEELDRSSRKRYFALCDLGDAAAVDVFVALAGTALGGLDVLVNCAFALAPENDAEAWSASLNVDLQGSDHPPLWLSRTLRGAISSASVAK